jgi:diguanylate cyclase (GGDEF)-like protein
MRLETSMQAWRRWWPWAAVIGVLMYLAALSMAGFVLLTRPSLVGSVAGPGTAIFTLVGIFFAVRAARHPGLTSEVHSAWRWIAAGCVALGVAGVLFNIGSTTTFPRPADIARLSMVPLMVTGLMRLPMRGGSRHDRVKLALDAGTVAAAAALVLWYVQVGPTVSIPHITPLRIAAASAYPVGDVALIFAVVVVLMRGVDAVVRRPIWLFAAAMVPWVVGDAYLGYRNSHPGSSIIAGPELLCFLTAHFLLCCAAFEQCRVANRPAAWVPASAGIRPISRLPYVSVAGAFAVMLYAAAREQRVHPWTGLVLCAAVLNGLVLARQVVAQQENLRIAITDGLTGLANRVQLQDALTLALARGQRSGTTTGVLLADLDGFKAVNDTLGHHAGDLLLVEFGQMLQRSVLGVDIAGRLGGDEFAVVLHDIVTVANAEAVVRRILSEAERPVMVGDVVLHVKPSIGIALCRPGEMDADELLHRADQAMYEAKRSRRPAAGAVVESSDEGR